MISAILFALLSMPSNAPTCETYAPRLDGSQVTVCGGSVVRVAMAPKVVVEAIDGATATVVSLDSMAAWTIDASRLPSGTVAGDVVYLGTSGAMVVR